MVQILCKKSPVSIDLAVIWLRLAALPDETEKLDYLHLEVPNIRYLG
jgi:hypothetical protein